MDNDMLRTLLFIIIGFVIIFFRIYLLIRVPCPPQPPYPTNKRILKEAVLNTLLPKISYNSDDMELKMEDCAICLAEFEDGDEIRIMPPCGHSFHVPCIDTWLELHSSCPYCRQILVRQRV